MLTCMFACQQSSVIAGIFMFYDLTIDYYNSLLQTNSFGFDVGAILKFADF